jgi:uncharacterized DUF497 family protein
MESTDGFDWDEGNRTKCQKHRVSLAEIEALFHGPMSIRLDSMHSAAERRYQAVGRTEAGRAVFVVFTLRDREGKRFIRPISARHMHRKEVEHYESQAPQTVSHLPKR